MFGIARGLGLSLDVDKRTLIKDFGLYARVLVDVDFTRMKFLTREETKDFLFILYMKIVPSYCNHCGVIGHNIVDCRVKIPGLKTMQTKVKSESLEDEKSAEDGVHFPSISEDEGREEKNLEHGR